MENEQYNDNLENNVKAENYLSDEINVNCDYYTNDEFSSKVFIVFRLYILTVEA